MSATPTTRRQALALAAGGLALVAIRPAAATPSARDAAIRDFAGAAAIRAGRVTLDLPSLVENGNAAPLTVSVESPMTEQDFVRRIAVFNEKNPQPHVFEAHLSPRAGRARIMTRIRLADTQRITAVAEMSDGTFWSATADVIVTLAACVEGTG